MKEFIEALTELLPFMKNPDDVCPFGAEHDVIIIYGVDWDKVPYETMKYLYSEYDIIPGNPFDRCYDFFGEDSSEEWDELTEEKWKNTPKDCLDETAFMYC